MINLDHYYIVRVMQRAQCILILPIDNLIKPYYPINLEASFSNLHFEKCKRQKLSFDECVFENITLLFSLQFVSFLQRINLLVFITFFLRNLTFNACCNAINDVKMLKGMN